VHVPSAAAAITRAILERTTDSPPKDRVSSNDRHGRATRKKRPCGKISARYLFGLLQRWRGYLPPPLYPGWRLWGSGKNPFLDRNSCPVTPSAPGRASGRFARRDLPDPVLAGSDGRGTVHRDFLAAGLCAQYGLGEDSARANGRVRSEIRAEPGVRAACPGRAAGAGEEEAAAETMNAARCQHDQSLAGFHSARH
jgi:hypothetical protein